MPTDTAKEHRPRRVALVTGVAAGIGQGYALRLARDGHRVAIADLGSADETEKLVREDGGEVFSVRCDVSDAESVARCAEAVTDRFGGVDILVHNAGIYPMAPFADTDWTPWRRIMDVNLDSVFHLTKAFLPAMTRGSWGRIVVMASTTFHAGSAGMVAYTASKGAVIGFVRSLAAEVGEQGVTVNAIAPGLVRTPGTLSGPQLELGAFDAIVANQAIKRTGLPEDLMGVVSFLATDDAAFMTGQTLVVDGGFVRA
ncbi:short chain dehydrogenase protein [Streptomyces bingchenggensis BCW-1]|uniref:Short chain dehydrogenase protein n=1 Tax=Streptomyces bingchenggensis (strain BCW-1) TaxID=749414 RepID=D7CDX9_STRBB|nr:MULTISPECIES: 3-oxoacyl-ACP reductase family protein [Streptomyces]ADI04644.1 short chain dehydrogenase protein [Streptomyces bingchenggensis BCW-1]